MGDSAIKEKSLLGENPASIFSSGKLKRDLFLDKLKGVAMFLVVWGHCIQYSSDSDFFHNPVFIIIYSFHMPVFMAISGYLYYLSTQKRNFKQLITIRFKQLIIPLLIWSVILLYLTHRHQLSTPMSWVQNYINYLPVSLWFIWSLFFCSVILAVINKLFHDSVLVYLAAVIIIDLLPDVYSLQYTKYMLPYFISGYFVHKYNLKSRVVLTMLAFAFFVVMIYYWQIDNYIYLSGMAIHNMHNLYTDIYRYLIGFLGIIVFVTIMKWFPNSKSLELTGRYSLGIYIISIFPVHILHYLNLKYDKIFFNFIFTPLLAVVIILICIGISMLIEKNKTLNKYLLGSK
jgi:fucose 4-O-acetylase-like acetyltransferase